MKLSFLLLMTSIMSALFACGQNWEYLPDSGLYYTNRIEDVYFTSLDTGFAATSDKAIFKTTNGGQTWQLKTPGTEWDKFRSIEFLEDKQTGIAGGLNYGRVYRTGDAGETWTDITDSIADTLALTNPYDRRICGLAHYGDAFYGVGWWGGTIAKFYKSTDKGLTWHASVIDNSLATNLVDIVFVSPDTGFVTGGRSTLSGAYTSNESVVLKTTDGGQTWAKVFSDSAIGGRIWKIQVVSPQLMVGAIEPYFNDTVAMIKSTDGGNTWTIKGAHSHESISNIGTQGVGFINPLKGWIGGWYQGIYETLDGGETWNKTGFGKNFNRFFIIDSAHAYAGGKGVYRYWDTTQLTSIEQPGVPTPPHDLYSISPNPSSGKVTIEFTLKSATNVVLEVANIETRRVYSIANSRMAAGHYVYTWDGSRAPAGVYMVWLGTDEIPIAQKFILFPH